MIIIADDTFETEKFSFLKEEKYTAVCKVFKTIKTTDLLKVKEEIQKSMLFCYHKSLQLFNPDENPLKNDDNHNFRENLITSAKEKVEFSGGIDDNNLSLKKMKKQDFYKNLRLFLDYYIQTQVLNLEILFFGQFTQENSNLGDENLLLEKKNFIFSVKEKSENINYSFFGVENFSDENLHQIIKQELDDEVFNSIFVPLNFTKNADFNGLRLAMHIRCTPTPNQLSTIFIYGVLPLDRLMDNPYFDILKTKNVFYIDYNKKSLQEAENKLVEVFSAELSTEIKKINLEAPKDNHSIANEWAIYRWAKSIQANDEDIEKINQKIEYNLYYKYLQTIYPISEGTDLQNIKIEFANEPPKVLYIDDEYEKGWNEIFATILYDNNKIDFESLETNFSASQEEIIQVATEKIKEKDIDTVILDFRLHKNDFNNKDIDKITSVRLLQEIKKINAGIQVIFFSATNKIWNLQKLQEFGADGFIIKESPENSTNPHFTQETIQNFQATIETAFERRFLKEIFKKIQEIREFVNSLFSENREIKNEINSFLDIAFELLYRESLSFAYLQLFLVIELFANHLLGNDNDIIYVDDVCVRKDNEQSIAFKNGKYVIEKQKLNGNQKKVDTNFKVASLLIYRYGFENSSALEWTKIYTSRNTKVSHYTENGNKIEVEDIYQILDFMLYIFKEDNVKETNKNKGLKVDINEDLQKLKEKFNTR